jgi:hypothetical protein
MTTRRKHTIESLKADALNYRKRGEFKKNDPAAYKASRLRGKEVFDYICSHMDMSEKSKHRKHTEESLMVVALRYKTRKEFQRMDHSAYFNAFKRGEDFFNKICSHMVIEPKVIKVYRTDKELEESAKKYNSRVEFLEMEPNAYRASQMRGTKFMHQICKHMIKRYSTPQLACKLIMEQLLKCSCLYDTRKIIPPYEIDVYFEKYLLAIEFNGSHWHNKPEVKIRDNKKKILCESKNITLININESSNDYITDVKSQIIQNLKQINHVCKTDIKDCDVWNVDCSDIHRQIFDYTDLDIISHKIKQCKSTKEFMKKFHREYKILSKTNNLKLLNYPKILKSVEYWKDFTDSELLELCKSMTTMHELKRNNFSLFNQCSKRGLLHQATKHMKYKPYKYIDNTLEELYELLKNNFHLRKGINNEIKRRIQNNE